jgi:[ribosomal protein S5]-alanine N-acetyltransferase
METPNFSPFPILKGQRITLRQINENDANAILALRSNVEAMHHVPRPLMKNLDEANAFIKILDDKLVAGEGINWAICLNNDEENMIGNICHFNFMLDANRSEIGYMLLPNYFRKGIMYEAIMLVLEYGFNVLNFNSTEAIIIAENIGSRKVAEKAGFILEGTCRESCFHNNRYYDQCFYGMLKSEFRK